MLRQTRALVGRLIEGLSDEQLLSIPPGFRNNILWNVGHLVVTQQIVHYRLSGREMYVPAELVAGFAKGTSPSDWRATPDVGLLKRLLVELPERLAEDYAKGGFEGFKPYQTATGPLLQDIEDAIVFNNFHEGLHTGVVSAYRKLVG